LLLLAVLLLPISASAPEHSINIAMYGYSVHERNDFIMDYWPTFDELVLMIKSLFPRAVLPETPIHFLLELEKLHTSAHPLLPGVLLSDGKWVIVDHANVKTRLEKCFGFQV